MTGLRSGTRIADRYVLETVLARGGMGAIYRAIDEKLGRTVVIKFLLAELAEDETCLARFEREVSATARLSHPGLVQVLDFGKHEGASYLVMEHLDGRSVAQELDAHGRVEPARACDWVEQALAGLSAAHAEGIVHRDIKPGNLMIVPTGSGASAREVVKVLDFGLAQLKESAPYQRLTKTGSVLGTPMFMAPEQARGESCDPRTDVYAMGVVLWCCLTAQKPYAGEGAEVLKSLLSQVPPRADAIEPSVPAAIASAVERAMQKSPAARFPSASAFAEALAAARQGVGVAASVPPIATAAAPGPSTAPSAMVAAVPSTRPAMSAGPAPSRAGGVVIASVLGLGALGALLVAALGGAYAMGLFDRLLAPAPSAPASGAPASSAPLAAPALPPIAAPPPMQPSTQPSTQPSAPRPSTAPLRVPAQGSVPADACARLDRCCAAFRARIDPDVPCETLAMQLAGRPAECDAQRDALLRTAESTPLPECQ